MQKGCRVLPAGFREKSLSSAAASINRQGPSGWSIRPEALHMVEPEKLAACPVGYYVPFSTFQRKACAVRSATAMPKLLTVLAILLLAPGFVQAAFETPK